MRYFLKTFGCQMNEADSEQIAASFEAKGYQPVSDYKKADVVIINTCSVRQSAEHRVMGLVNNLHKLQVKGRKLQVILTGCMLRYPLVKLKKMLPGVDQFVKLKDLIPPILNSKFNSEFIIHNSKFVKIMEGCDNFCTYCVVPSARGREISRPLEEILCEVNELVKRGVKEITLLGQNVNSYYKNLEFRIQNSELKNKVKKLKKRYKNNFAVLLALLHSIEGLKKISFLTSNPQDLTDDIIEVMKLPKIDRYLHLAVQSGSDEILKKMNRRYSAQQYLNLINKLRKAIPEIEIGTDIIVGFPGETDEQFQETVALCKKAKFCLAYISKYSPRWGTPAYQLKDDIPFQIKKARWKLLNQLINKGFDKQK